MLGAKYVSNPELKKIDPISCMLGLQAITESNAELGSVGGGADVSSFMHGFFMVAELGQMAQRGVSLVARWSVTTLLKKVKASANAKDGDAHRSGSSSGSGGAAPYHYSAASDFWLYLLHNQTMGHGVLGVSGDDVAGSDVLVYAHCAASTVQQPSTSPVPKGAVTVLVANPSTRTATVSLAGVKSTLPRLEYVLTPPAGDCLSHTPILNGRSSPLELGKLGAALPPLGGKLCTEGGCAELITVPPLSQSFFVLLGASASAC